MVEWFKAPVLKTGVRVTVPGVRIPLSPWLVLFLPWRGARVAEWGSLLRSCTAKTVPEVRILSSPDLFLRFLRS